MAEVITQKAPKRELFVFLTEYVFGCSVENDRFIV